MVTQHLVTKSQDEARQNSYLDTFLTIYYRLKLHLESKLQGNVMKSLPLYNELPLSRNCGYYIDSSIERQCYFEHLEYL